MEQTNKSKKYLLAVILFAAMAIGFGVVYYLNLIKNLSLIMAVPYILYFVGIAIFFNGSYCGETNRPKAKRWNYFFGFLIILAAAGILIYGFVTGQVHMFESLF